jgi:hypothetical protein
MAGEFVVWRMSPEDKANVMTVLGAKWTDLAHKANTANGAGGVFPGWTPESRAALSRVRDGIRPVENRNGLPPHRYLEIPHSKLSRDDLISYLRTCYWINDLQRPSERLGFGSKALCSAAQRCWNERHKKGGKAESLADQVVHGPTSIEIYYLGGKEMF